jgi:topoisomerase IA-like protein
MYKKNEDLYPGKYKTYINSHKMNSTLPMNSTNAAIIIQRVWRKYKTYKNSQMNSTSAAINSKGVEKIYIFKRSGSLIGRFFSWFWI